MRILLIPGAMIVLVLAAACGGGDSATPAESTAKAVAQATIDSAIENAEELGVTDETRAYARQWCDPLKALFDEFTDTAPVLEAAEDTEDFAVFLEIFDILERPLEVFSDALEDMDPPEEYETYHAGIQAEISYALEAVKLIKEGGFFAALALGDEPPEIEEPPELESAFAIECGEEFLEILGGDAFDDFFGDGGSTDEPLATGPGTSRGEPAPLGTSVQTPDNLEVRVLAVNFDAWPAVQADNDFNDPPRQGNRMVLITVEVSYTGAGDETVFLSGSQFSLTDSRNIVSDSFDEGVYCGSVPDDLNGELFSGGAIQGNVCFQYPEDETALILIIEPMFSFGSTDRRYLALE